MELYFNNLPYSRTTILWMLVTLMTGSMTVHAQNIGDKNASFTIDGMSYLIIDESNGYVKITAIDEAIANTLNHGEAAIMIPDLVHYEDRDYIVYALGDGLFQDIGGITSISLPDTMVEIGNNCFWNCKDLTELNLGKNLNDIGDFCFHGNMINLQSITFPETLNTIGYCSFTMQTPLKELKFPSSLRFIDENCFRGLEKLEHIDFSNLVDCSFGRNAFWNLPAIQRLELPEAFHTITPITFCNLASLEELILPLAPTDLNEVWITETSFLNLPLLTKIFNPNIIPPNMIDVSGGNYRHTFGGHPDFEDRIDKSKCTLYVPVGSRELYASDPSWQGFKKIEEYTPAGINGISNFTENANNILDVPVEYFDLTGRRVLYPATGKIYLRRQGNIITKIELLPN